MIDLAGLRVTLLAGTLGQGGSERQLYYAAATLRRAGASPQVLSLTKEEFWEDPLRDLGVPVTWVGVRPGRAARLAAVARAAARHRPDLLQSFHFYANPYAAMAARMLRIPDLGAVRSSGTADLASVGGLLGKMCLRLPRLLVANSEAAIDNLLRMGVSRQRLWLLPNVIDTAAFAPAMPLDPSRPFTVAAVGRLVPQKRFDRAIRVIASLGARLERKVQLVIAGDGPQRAALDAIVADHGLGDRVTFTGVLADIRPVLQRADCLLLTSDYEGTPNVILEAMALGRPVVATDVGGIRRIVEPSQTGLLAPPDDEAALCAALAHIAEDPALAQYLGAQARLRVERFHSLSRLSDNLRLLYGEVLPGHARGPAPVPVPPGRGE